MYTNMIQTIKDLESLDLNVPNIVLDKQNALSSKLGWNEEFTKVLSAIQVHNGVFIRDGVLCFLKENFIDMYDGKHEIDRERIRALVYKTYDV